MQQTIDREQRVLDLIAKGLHVYLTLFAMGLVALAAASPSIARATGDWVGIPFAVLFGLAGLAFLVLEVHVARRKLRELLARRSARRLAQQAAADRLASVLTERPEMYSPVRVLEATWTPFGTLFPDDIGTVLPLELEDDSLVLVRWARGENITDWRNLAEG